MPILSKYVVFILLNVTFSDAVFGDLPTSMDTESSNGKEGMVKQLDRVISTFITLHHSFPLRDDVQAAFFYQISSVTGDNW